MFPARRSDIASSHLAAADFIASGLREQHQQIVFELVTAHPGSTSRELATQTNQLDHHQISRRLSEVERQGKIRKGEIRTCRIVNRKCVEWFPVSDADMRNALLAEVGINEEEL